MSLTNDGIFLGVDTSNYTTSIAVASASGEIIANLKNPLPVKEGERGLRQSDALFHHTAALPLLMERALEYVNGKKILAVGVSKRPCDREGSYMPCFLAGVSFASGAALGADCPVFSFSHQCGHIMAALYSSDSLSYMGKPFAAFHVSGGTTDILYVTPAEDERPFRVERIGGTLDINAGQAIDRAGVYMGLSFPCGPELERLALSYEGNREKARICVKDLFCNLSGLENKASQLFDKTADKGAVASYVLGFVSDTLEKLSENLRERYPEIPIVYAGGVMSCSLIKDRLSKFGSFAKPAFSADNAAGIALLAKQTYFKE